MLTLENFIEEVYGEFSTNDINNSDFGLQKPKILANRWRHPDGTILQSFHRHDFVEYNGCFVDGGLSGYVRISGHLEDCCVYDDSPFEDIRNYFHWGTYGKDGEQPRKFVALKDLELEQIQAIIETQKQIPDCILDVFTKEMEYRAGLK